MFATLKNKIKAETGAEIQVSGPHQQSQRINHNNNRIRSRFSSTLSVNSTDDSIVNPPTNGSEQQRRLSDEMSTLRSHCNDLTTKVADLTSHVNALQEEKTRIEKTNEILLETVRVAQMQKDLYCEEQQKIQNMQEAEIDKLKNLLAFREHEAVDRLDALRQFEKQVENLNAEVERLKQFEPMAEDLKDELQRLQHSSQQGRNSLTTTLAAVKEENRHMKKRIEICEKARLESINKLSPNEQLQSLINERKLLEQHLEEAHLQLSDIKSSWSGQNLALETQVSRLSKQVAEETTEKRKAITARDDLIEKIKQLEFEMLKLRNEIQQRDDKIQLLEDEIDELNVTLRETREENEQQILFERNKVTTLETTIYDLKTRLNDSEDRYNEYTANTELMQKSLRQQIDKLEIQLVEVQNSLDSEKEEKLTALLRNAEISQSEEKLRAELRNERDEVNELHEQQSKLQIEIKAKQQELQDLRTELQTHETKIKESTEMQNELTEKNKTIKILNQRLADLKKTLQMELRGTKQNDSLNNGHVPSTTIKSFCLNCGSGTESGIKGATFSPIAANSSPSMSTNAVVMDEVNFKYLKHVIIKFLTSREVEARHLIRAVATLLQLTKDEEKLLHDTLNWKMSWFGSKPGQSSGQNAFSLPPS